MRRHGGAFVVATAVALVAGCSGGTAQSDHVPATTSPPAAVAAELSPDVRADLDRRMLTVHEWPRATAVAGTRVYAPAEAAALDPDPVAEAKRLEDLGLVAAAAAHVRVPGAQDGVASVFRFRTATGARAMAARMGATKGTTPFAVRDVPGAVGYEVVDSRGTLLASNVTFTVDDYVYTVGAAVASVHPLGNAELVAAAKGWYARVRAT